MSMRRALQIILGISLVGIAFSGALTWRAFSATTTQSGGCTALAEPGTLLGYPPCVYGLIMYVALFLVAFLGLRGARIGSAG
jgi:hypothetical protein